MRPATHTLDDACNALQSTLNQLTDTFAAIRGEERPARNQRIANAEFWRLGYEGESYNTYKENGVIDAKTDEEVYKIVHDIVDYRRDAMLHHTGERTI